MNSFSLTHLSVAGFMTSGSLPQFQISISIIGQEINFGPTPASITSLGSSVSDFFNTFKNSFSLNFCVVTANCPSGQVCSTFKCVSTCPAGYSNIALIGISACHCMFVCLCVHACYVYVHAYVYVCVYV